MGSEGKKDLPPLVVGCYRPDRADGTVVGEGMTITKRLSFVGVFLGTALVLPPELPL